MPVDADDEMSIESDSEQVTKNEFLFRDLAGMPEEVVIEVFDDYFPNASIARIGPTLAITIEEHIYTKFWQHKYHAKFFAEALVRAAKRLEVEGHPFSSASVDNSDEPHYFMNWTLNLPASTPPQEVLDSIQAAFELVWARADAILDDSDSVLLLGKDTGDGMDRLKEIQEALETLGYFVYIVKEQPDRLGETIIQKVMRFALSAHFVLVENTEPSGHLYEIPHVGKDAEALMIFLQESGKGSTWMFEDGYFQHGNWHKEEYLPGALADAVKRGCKWAEEYAKEFRAHQVATLPWFKAP